jgi:hypothetical protein
MEMKFDYKVVQFELILKDFFNSMNYSIEILPNNEELLNIARTSNLKKFEIASEFMWKLIRLFLINIHGLECNSPKMVLKCFFEQGYCGYEEYEVLINIIEDRNRLSHIYLQDMALDIHDKLYVYYNLMLKIFNLIKNDKEIKK